MPHSNYQKFLLNPVHRNTGTSGQTLVIILPCSLYYVSYTPYHLSHVLRIKLNQSINQSVICTLIHSNMLGNSLPPCLVPSLSPSAACAAGAMLACSFALVPGEVLKTRLQASSAQASLADIVSSIFKQDGVKGFFAGYGATLLRDVPYTMLELGVSFVPHRPRLYSCGYGYRYLSLNYFFLPP